MTIVHDQFAAATAELDRRAAPVFARHPEIGEYLGPGDPRLADFFETRAYWARWNAVRVAVEELRRYL